MQANDASLGILSTLSTFSVVPVVVVVVVVVVIIVVIIVVVVFVVVVVDVVVIVGNQHPIPCRDGKLDFPEKNGKKGKSGFPSLHSRCRSREPRPMRDWYSVRRRS